MKLYVTRHGESEFNLQNKASGRLDVDLTELGVKQADELALKLSQSKAKIDIVISSPLKRAKKTADIVAAALSTDVIVDDRLIEQSYGVYEGGLRDNSDFVAVKRQFATRMPDGESIFEMAQRIYNFMDETIKLYRAQNVLIISHIGSCKIIHAYFNDLTDEEFHRYRLGNCELSCYEIK